MFKSRRIRHILACISVFVLLTDYSGFTAFASEEVIDVDIMESETVTEDTIEYSSVTESITDEDILSEEAEIWTSTESSTEEEATTTSEEYTSEDVTTDAEVEEGGYSINTDLLYVYSCDEIMLAEADSSGSAFWTNQYHEIVDRAADIDYLQGAFYYEAKNENEAKLIAEIYNAELLSYGYGIATVQIDNYGTEDILETCVKTSKELEGKLSLPKIYADTKVYAAFEEDETDEEIELQMTYGGYDDWSHEANGDYAAWNYATGAGVRVAILDTGAATHRDIRYTERHNAFADDYTDPANARANHGSYNDVVDNSGHGTAVAGIIAGKGGNNNESVIGVAPDARLISIKCLEKYGSEVYGDTATVIRGIYMAIEHNCKIVNISFNDKAVDGSLYEKAVNEAVNSGLIIVCSAGNTANSAVTYPATCENVICVSSTRKTESGQVFDSSYSCYGDYVDFAAPGTGIMCAAYGAKDAYEVENGTSISAAMMSGALALYVERNPELKKIVTKDATEKAMVALKKTVTDAGEANWDDKYGHGIINTAMLIGTGAFNMTASPKLSIAGGVIQSDVGIRMYSLNGDSSIYYTVDGTVPTQNSLKYSAERDAMGLIYLPENVGQVCVKAVSISPVGTTPVTEHVFNVVPSSIKIEDSKYVYNGELGRTGFAHDYAPVKSITRGKDMPYQLFTMDLNGGDSVQIVLKASGFNGELYLICDEIMKTYDIRPVTAAKVDARYERTIKYSNATRNKQKLKIVVTSGELLQGQTLGSGSGKYTLNVDTTRNISRLSLILPRTGMVKGTSMQVAAVITPYDAVNKKVTWRLTDKYGEEVNKAYAAIDVNGKITVKTDVTSATQYTVRATSVADENLYAESKFTVYPVVTRIESIEDKIDLTSNGSNKTYDLSKNFVITPTNSLGQYKYTSANKKVATVDDKGLVTAVGPGSTVITTTAADGSNKKCTCRVNVTTLVSSITLSPATKVDPVSTYYPACADSVIRIDAAVLPANASNKKIQYGFDGLVPNGISIVGNKIIIDKGVAAGQVFTVSATALDGSGRKNTLRFKTYSRPFLIELNEEKLKLDTVTNKTAVLKATVKDENDNVTGVLQNVKWESSDTKVATVSDSGTVTVVGKGRAKIKATACDGSKVKKQCTVDVISAVTAIGISTAGSLQGPSNAQPVVAGRKTALKAECTPANANNTGVIWTLKSAPEGVTLDQGTIFVPANVKSGSVMVTATAADGFGATKTRTFNIYPDSVRKVVISSTASELNTVTNRNCMLTAVTSPATTTFAGVLWFSSNEKIATVSSSGYVTAVGPGTVKITAYAKDGYGAKSTISLKVIQPITGLRVTTAKGTVTNDSKLLLTTGVNKLNITNIVPAQVSDKKVTWKLVEDVSGVTINEKNGRVTVAPDVANRITNLTVRVVVNSSGAYIDQPVAVYPKTTKVYLSPSDSNFKLTIGQGRMLKPTVMPIHAYNSYAANKFLYTSSDPNIVKVTDEGIVTAVGSGSARIIITATDGSNKKAIAKVKVY